MLDFSLPKRVPRLMPPELLGYEAFFEVVDKVYNKETLVALYKNVLQPILAVHCKPLANLAPNARKVEYTKMIVKVYRDEVLFKAVLASLPAHIQKAFEILVWQGPRTMNKLEFELGHALVELRVESMYGSYKREVYTSSDYCKFFQFRDANNYYYRDPRFNEIGFVPELRLLFQQHLPPPPAATLTPEAPPKDSLLLETEAEALQSLQRYLLFIREGHIEYGKNERPLKKSIKNMAQYCEVSEFFDDTKGPLNCVSTELLIDVINAYGASITESADGLSELTQLLDKYQRDNRRRLSVGDLYLGHLKGRGYYDYFPQEDEYTRLTLMYLMTQLPPATWINVDTLHDHALIHNLFLYPYPIEAVSRMSVNTVKTVYFQQSAYYSASPNLGVDYYDQAVTRPLLRGHLALMGLLGLVDIAYTRPTNDILQDSSKTFLTPFDGITHVRLTALGAYLTKQSPTYIPSGKAQEEPVKVLFDDVYLLFSFSHDHKIKRMIAEQVGTSLGPLRYRVDFASFLQGCTTRDDVDKQIERFRTHIAKTPPPHWEAFFAEVRQKVAPLKPCPNVLVFELDGGPELVNLMARDEVLKKHVLKAEGYRIILEERNLAAVRRRLESFGYLMER